MNNRERNKDYNRRKILAAARLLLKEGGLNTLSMRTLAERAQVSSRTPYNLFGSKTDVLVALMDEPLQEMIAELPTPAPGNFILETFSLIDRIHELYHPEIEYYREIYWGVMSSGHHEARQKYLERTLLWVPRVLKAARDSRELKGSTDIEALASHITFTVFGFLGLWASSLLTAPELTVQLKRALAHCFYCHGSKSVQKDLKSFID